MNKPNKISLKYLKFVINWAGQFEKAYQNHNKLNYSPIPLPRHLYLMGLTEGVSLTTKMWMEANQTKLKFSDE